MFPPYKVVKVGGYYSLHLSQQVVTHCDRYGWRLLLLKTVLLITFREVICLSIKFLNVGRYGIRYLFGTEVFYS